MGAGTVWPQQHECMEQPCLEHGVLSIPCSTASCVQLVRCSYFSRVPISVGAGHVDGDCASSVGLVLGFCCFHLKNDWKSKIQHWCQWMLLAHGAELRVMDWLQEQLCCCSMSLSATWTVELSTFSTSMMTLSSAVQSTHGKEGMGSRGTCTGWGGRTM